MHVIAIDPSLTATGLAYMDLDAGKVIDWACVRTKKDDRLKATEDLARRIQEVAAGVRDFCNKYPGIVAIEGQTGGSYGLASPPTIFLLGTGYGACLAAIPGKPIVIASATVKARVVGDRGKTTKDAAWQAAQPYFTSFPPEPKTKPAREAVHDAVVVGVAALPELNQLSQIAGSPRP